MVERLSPVTSHDNLGHLLKDCIHELVPDAVSCSAAFYCPFSVLYGTAALLNGSRFVLVLNEC